MRALLINNGKFSLSVVPSNVPSNNLPRACSLFLFSSALSIPSLIVHSARSSLSITGFQRQKTGSTCRLNFGHGGESTSSNIYLCSGLTWRVWFQKWVFYGRSEVLCGLKSRATWRRHSTSHTKKNSIDYSFTTVQNGEQLGPNQDCKGARDSWTKITTIAESKWVIWHLTRKPSTWGCLCRQPHVLHSALRTNPSAFDHSGLGLMHQSTRALTRYGFIYFISQAYKPWCRCLIFAAWAVKENEQNRVCFGLPIVCLLKMYR